MQPFYSNGVATLYQANALDLSFLPAESVHCVITSPPYWSLRNYGLGAEGIGQEATLEEYVERLVLAFRQVRRILRKDGILWLNLGSSYAGSNNGADDYRPEGSSLSKSNAKYQGQKPGSVPGLKPLDLIGLPHRVAFALQADGWYLRSEIIWVKGREHEDGTLGLNPMPESIRGWFFTRHQIKIKSQDYSEYTQPGKVSSGQISGGHRNRDAIGGVWQGGAEWADCPGCVKCEANDGLVLRKGAWRPTDAFECIFMLTKSPVYFCDQEAVRVPHADVSIARYFRNSSYDGSKPYAMKHGPSGHGIQKWDVDGMPTWVKGHSGYIKADGTLMVNSAGANPRNIWVFPSEPTKEKHYATFPRELPRRCIQASTSEHGVCSRCGSQYAPVVNYKTNFSEREAAHVPNNTPSKVDSTGWHEPEIKLFGYRATCTCNAPRGQAVVLDPFCGSGTTCVAAQELGRQSIGVDLSLPYLDIARRRIEAVSLPLATIASRETDKA